MRSLDLKQPGQQGPPQEEDIIGEIMEVAALPYIFPAAMTNKSEQVGQEKVKPAQVEQERCK